MTLYEMLEEAVEELARLADIHHRTIEGSRLHDPENVVWEECDCDTCRHARAIVEKFKSGPFQRIHDYARNADGSYMTPEQSDQGWAVQ